MISPFDDDSSWSADPRKQPGRVRGPMWYACYTRARHEKQVARLLGDRGIEPYLPMVPRKRQWTDRVTTVDWPLFPSYVFCRFELPQLHAVLSTPGVSTVVRSNGVPVAVPEAELENVRRFAEKLVLLGGPEPERVPYPEVGDEVRVAEGPLEGVEGVVVEVRGRKRVVVGLKMIGHGLLVHVDGAAVRKIERRRSRQIA